MPLPKASPANEYHYNSKLSHWASQLRKRSTVGEKTLWKYALNKRKSGYVFNRQRPVLLYIADFMCRPLLLIVEIDGARRNDPEVAKNDVTRQQDLEDVGFMVVRYSEGDARFRYNEIAVALRDIIERREKELGYKK